MLLRFTAFLWLTTCWALAQSQLFPVGKIVTTVPGQKGSYILKLNDGVQVKVGDAFLVEGLTKDPIKLEVSAIEADSVLVRTSDNRVFLSPGTEVGSLSPLTVSAGKGSGQMAGTQRSKGASGEMGPSAQSESVLARDRARLKNTSLRERYDEPVVTNGPVATAEVFSQPQYAQNDVATPMADFNSEQSRMARETTDGTPYTSNDSDYNRSSASGASSFERPGVGSFDANLPATFVVEKAYFFLDNRRNVCIRMKVRNKGGQAARFQAACDCTNSGGRIVYSVTKEMPRLEPGGYDYFNVLTSLKPRSTLFSGAGYSTASSIMTEIETEEFGQVRAKPKVQALKD